MQVLVILAYFKCEGNLLCIVMQVDHLELKTLSCYFQNFQELVQLYFIQKLDQLLYRNQSQRI
jgi:Gpi18-like mannosyltransferase